MQDKLCCPSPSKYVVLVNDGDTNDDDDDDALDVVAQVVPTVTMRINDDKDVVLSNGLVIPRRTAVYPMLGSIHMNPLDQ